MGIAVVFAFTTLWHGDFELKLLLWGSLMALLVVPEMLTKHWYYTTHNATISRMRGNVRCNRYVHAAGALVNIMVLLVANLIGFGPGSDLVLEFFGIVIGQWLCVATFGVVCGVVF